MNIQKAIKVLDIVTTAIVDGTINTSFVKAALRGKLDIGTYQHILNKWESKENDFFDFYLNSSEQRVLLEALNIEVEPDKYPDYDSRIKAQILGGKKRSEIYPFETEIVNTFFLFGYNHSLQELEKISPSAWQTVQENGIDLYGNYRNWSEYWCRAVSSDKELLLTYITKNKDN